MKYEVKDHYKTDYRVVNTELDDPYQTRDPFVCDLWAEILLTYGDWDCVLVNSYKQIEDGFMSFIRQFTRILDQTYDRYTTILKYYARQRTTLLVQLQESTSGKGSASSERRFNDTPQNVNADEAATSDYLTDYTKTDDETESSNVHKYDAGTPMALLREIQTSYDQTLRDWVAEFKDLFWPTDIRGW